MPFIAQSDDESTTILPEVVENGTDAVCPACGGVMRPRGPFEDGRARHFYHVNSILRIHWATAPGESRILTGR